MIIALAAILVILAVSWIGSLLGLQVFFGMILPLAALLIFIVGFIWRILVWAKSPVPFAIPTTGGQQKSLDWIKPSRLDTPFTTAGLLGRMCLEVVTFRSLFRNSAARRSTEQGESRLTYYSSKWLWLFALIFHFSMLVILVRHFRLVLDPVPFAISAVEMVDGMFQIGAPRFYLTDALILAGLGFLLLRRLYSLKLRYISQPTDYFAIFLLLAVAISGISMRYLTPVDIAQVKTYLMSLVQLRPISPQGIGAPFFIHVAFVSSLLIYFPFSKLMHMGGIFMSPSRNTLANTRQVRHVNPWNPPKKFHTYAAYEDEFRAAMVEAGLPVDKPLAPADCEQEA